MGKMIRNTYLRAGIELAALVALALVLLEPRLVGFDQDFMQETVIPRHIMRLAVLFTMVFVGCRLFLIGVVRNGRIGPRWKNVLTSAFAIFLVLILLESIFMFIPYSNGVGYTYASQIWFAYYWRTNELGYRDKLPSEIDQTKPLIALVGDSFTAGHGIRSVRDTTAGQLQEMAGNRFTVMNLGRDRADTKREFNNLLNYPLTPDVIVLQYYGNDIDPAAVEAGIPWGKFTAYADVGLIGEFIMRGSVLFNYIYWRYPHQDLGNYRKFLIKAYHDPEAMSIHFHDLEKFVNYAKECRVQLLVVLFPFLRDTELSHVFIDPIGKFFRSQSVPVIDVTSLLPPFVESERVVNMNDAHPSPIVDRRLAEAIWEKLRTVKLTSHSNQCRTERP